MKFLVPKKKINENKIEKKNKRKEKVLKNIKNKFKINKLFWHDNLSMFHFFLWRLNNLKIYYF